MPRKPPLVIAERKLLQHHISVQEGKPACDTNGSGGSLPTEVELMHSLPFNWKMVQKKFVPVSMPLTF